ncbi:MAG: hypothetical protein FJZ95_09305, partial [Chloroflexi bacterium]|nr:hypothetical protein [Chloroflexota bacterium]
MKKLCVFAILVVSSALVVMGCGTDSGEGPSPNDGDEADFPVEIPQGIEPGPVAPIPVQPEPPTPTRSSPASTWTPPAPRPVLTTACKGSEIVVFPDRMLDMLIRARINKPSGNICQDDLAAITSFQANFQKISDLSGMEYCVQLKYLRLRLSEITDVSPLSGITTLHTIDLFGNQIRDIGPLSELENLSVCDLSVNGFSDITSLASLTNLTELSLSENPITDIGALRNLGQLELIELSGTGISDISALAELPSLKKVYLR